LQHYAKVPPSFNVDPLYDTSVHASNDALMQEMNAARLAGPES